MSLEQPTIAPITDPRTRLAESLRGDRPLVMGVLNVTPDSFSDGGRYFDPVDAIAQARRMADEGADIIDVGAESTRPYGGAEPISAAEEIRRLADVLPAVVALGVPVSIDTMKASVAAFALAGGCVMVNDVWGLQRDPDMAPLVARAGVPVVVMHNRLVADATIDIVADVEAFFARSLAIANEAGIAPERVVLDPGIGFGKTPAQSVVVLAATPRFAAFGRTLLVGASRKRFIDHVSPAPADRRIGGSLAAHLAAVRDGAKIVRAHDVAETVQALRVLAAIEGAR